MQVPKPLHRFQYKDQFNNATWQFWAALAIKSSYKYKLMHVWVTIVSWKICCLNLLKINTIIIYFHTTVNYETLLHLGVPVLYSHLNKDFFLKEKLIGSWVLGVALWVAEAFVGTITLHYSQIHRYPRPHLEEAYKHCFHSLKLTCILQQCHGRQKD